MPYIYLIAISYILTIAALCIFILRLKKQILSLNMDNDYLYRFIHHETKRQLMDIKDEVVKIIPTEITSNYKTKATNLINAYYSLYDVLENKDKNKLVELAPIVKIITDIYITDVPTLQFNINVIACTSFKKANSFVKLFNELIANTVEHSIIDISKPCVNISILENENNIVILYNDTGNKLPLQQPTLQDGKGLFYIYHIAINNLNGTITKELMNNLVTYKIIFPKD